MLSIEAHAKVNLALEVVGRRADGFHDVVSVMQTVGLADRIEIRPADEVSVWCSVPSLSGPANLAYRAAILTRERFGLRAGCTIRIEKRIPEAAGLGGGSSDGAAALVGLAQLWGVPADCSTLVELAATLGSDVPFFLYGGTCLIRGRGEVVQRLPGDPVLWYVLANPGFRVSTREVFGALTASELTCGGAVEALVHTIERGGLVSPGVNGLQDALFRLEPPARECFRAMQGIAPKRTFVSGSGPTVAAAFERREDAERAHAAVREVVPWSTVTSAWIPIGGEMPCG